MTDFNAWRDPWVPVTDGLEDTFVSLRDLYLTAHELTGLGRGLSPLDIDSMLRFLPTIGAMILRAGQWDGMGELAAFSAGWVERFESSTDLTIFDLAGDRPFLQRWDFTCADVDALVDDKRRFLIHPDKSKTVLLPIQQLPQDVPGFSSAFWATRREVRPVSSPADVARLLVTTWFQTKNGNAKDAFGRSCVKGSTGTWHVNPLGVFAIDPDSLLRTLLANIPYAWVEGASLPAFFEHNQSVPPDRPLDLYRCTYAKTLPLVYFDGDTPVGFALGADETVPDPELGKDVKESLGLVHAHDHTRLYVRVKEATKARGSFGVRVSSAEGFLKWFAEDSALKEAVQSWASDHDRVLPPTTDRWLLGIVSETTDGKGTRQWCDWSTLPFGSGGGSSESYVAVSTLMSVVAAFRRSAYYGMKEVTGSSKASEANDSAQAALLSSMAEPLAGAVKALNDEPERDARPLALQFAHAAVVSFKASTDAYVTPQHVQRVAQARAGFERSVYVAVNKTYVKENQ